MTDLVFCRFGHFREGLPERGMAKYRVIGKSTPSGLRLGDNAVYIALDSYLASIGRDKVQSAHETRTAIR